MKHGGDWLDKHIEEFFATNQLNLIDNRIARDERTVEDKFGYNLVVINNKRYSQTHEDVKDNYARDYQQAIVQHLTIGSTLINSLKELIIKKDLKERSLSLYH